MKKAILKELAWLIGLFIIVFLLYGWFFSNYALDINAHDTYNADGSIFYPAGLAFTYFIMVSFLVYMIRSIFTKFKVVRIMLFLIGFTCFFLFVLEYRSYTDGYFLLQFITRNNGDSGPIKGLFYGGDSSVLLFYQFVTWLKILLTLILAFTSFMVGRSYEKAAVVL